MAGNQKSAKTTRRRHGKGHWAQAGRKGGSAPTGSFSTGNIARRAAFKRFHAGEAYPEEIAKYPGETA